MKNELKKIMQEKNFELRNRYEMEGCTFKPKINSVKKTKNLFATKENRDDGSNLYQRNERWKKKKNDK
jgi:hypothetical protein